MLLFSSWLRCSAAVLALPVCIFLIWLPASRRVGASVLLWIATVGYDQTALLASIEVFAKRFEQGERGIRWRNDGLRALERHLAAGDRVLVVTAAPVWLLGRFVGCPRAGLGSPPAGGVGG